MKKIFFIILFFGIISCIGSDTEYLPASMSESKNKGLLIKVYQPTKNKITINNTEYIIEEAFTTFKLNSKKDQTINKSFFAFSIQLRSLKTHEEGLSPEDMMHYTEYINFNCNLCAGIDTDHIIMYYDDIRKRDKLDSIKIGFTNHNKQEEVIYFIQKH